MVYGIAGESGRSPVMSLQAVIVLLTQVDRGSVIKCKLIGVLKLLDYGEHDNKLITAHSDSAFYEVT